MSDLHLTLKNGMKMPRLGMGTWMLGEHLPIYQQEKKALQAGLDAGFTLIDTAEMYGNGLSEKLIGDTIQEYSREKLFLVSKVYPHNAGRPQIYDSIDQTLCNLKTDYLDMYLLHWRGSIPLEETVDAMEELVKKGKIRSWGVSNLDTSDMKKLFSVPNGDHCQVDQVLYHLGSRGIEYDLMPWLEEHQTPVMAYCPLAQAGSLQRSLLKNKEVQKIAKAHGITPMQVLLAFILQKDQVIAIPRSGRTEHVLQNWAVKDVILTDEEYVALDRAFPAPEHKTYLDIV